MSSRSRRQGNSAVSMFAGGRFPALYPILDADCVFGSQPPAPSERWTMLRRLIQELAEAGVSLLQYRNKRDDDRTVTEDALAMRSSAPASMKLILNDRPALVGPAGWDGVHVGQDDLSPAEARVLAGHETIGDETIVGLSTHNEEQVVAADRERVDYIAIGPVFATSSKSDTSPVIGLEGVERARALTRKPLVAIGGVTLENAPSVYDAGADSVAVISAVFRPSGGRAGRAVGDCVRDFLEIFK
jgi:thiamine-phosphate pyrophosphorylase